MSLAYHKIAGPKAVSAVVKWEHFSEFCREGFTLEAGDGGERHVRVGELIAKSPNGDLVVGWDPTADDGREVIHGISRVDIKAPVDQDRSGGVANVRDCILSQDEIVWPEGITDEQKTQALQDLKELRLIPR